MFCRSHGIREIEEQQRLRKVWDAARSFTISEVRELMWRVGER